MFDAKVDISWVKPLVVRAAEALESMAESQRTLAETAKLQADAITSHLGKPTPPPAGNAPEGHAEQAPASATVTQLPLGRGGKRRG